MDETYTEVGDPVLFLSQTYTDLGDPVLFLDRKTTEKINDYISSRLRDIYRAAVGVYGNMLIEQQHHSAFRQGLWEAFVKTKSLPLSPNHFHAWISQNFDKLHDARKTMLKISFKKDKGCPTSLRELKEDISAVFPDMKLEADSPVYKWNIVRQACEMAFIICPVFYLIQRYDKATDEQIDRVTQYFGAPYLRNLTESNYWRNFKTIKQLLDFIDESPENLCDAEDEYQSLMMRSALVREHLLTAIPSCMDPTVKSYFNFDDTNDNTHRNIAKVIEKLEQTDGISKIEQVRLLVQQKHTVFDPVKRASNSEFYAWVKKIVHLQTSEEFKQVHEEGSWRSFHQNMRFHFRAVNQVLAHLNRYPTDSLESARALLREIHSWVDKEMKATGPPSNPLLQKGTASIIDLVDSGVVIVERLFQRFEASVTIKQEILKRSLVNLLENNNMCPVCGALGHYHKDPKSPMYLHKFEKCPLREKMGHNYMDADNIRKGNALYQLLQCLDEEAPSDRYKRRRTEELTN